MKRLRSSCFFSYLTEQIKRGCEYIVQQGTEMAQLEVRSYDIRILMHKPLDRWQLGWVVRWSKREMIETNIHRGGERQTRVTGFGRCFKAVSIPKYKRVMNTHRFIRQGS
ncbi:YheC/YheD family protein [Polycladomyces abyssicola]|uniref:YheC/YheD family protein n=1 Tax=Polycladomyces abyssicola TaxID=1125966 RepID=UPI003B831A9C